MSDLLSKLYAAANRAGFLQTCIWQPPAGQPLCQGAVHFTAADALRLEGLTTSTEYQMSYPAGQFPGLAPGQTVLIQAQSYQVREVRAIGEGAEQCARLSRRLPGGGIDAFDP